MRTTIDAAGRIVIPKQLRDQIGLAPGPVDVQVMGNSIQIDVLENEANVREDEDGFFVIEGAGPFGSDDELRSFRLGLQERRSDG